MNGDSSKRFRLQVNHVSRRDANLYPCDIHHVGRRNNTIYLLWEMKSIVMQKYFIGSVFQHGVCAGVYTNKGLSKRLKHRRKTSKIVL